MGEGGGLSLPVVAELLGRFWNGEVVAVLEVVIREEAAGISATRGTLGVDGRALTYWLN